MPSQRTPSMSSARMSGMAMGRVVWTVSDPNARSSGLGKPGYTGILVPGHEEDVDVFDDRGRPASRGVRVDATGTSAQGTHGTARAHARATATIRGRARRLHARVLTGQGPRSILQ